MTKLPRRRVVQPFGRIATVGTLALLLAGSLAPPAEARRADYANSLISACFNAGQDPYTFEFMGVVGVACPDHLNVYGVATNTGLAVAGESRTLDDHGAAADAVDHGRQKTHKQQKHKHKAHASKHGHKHSR